MKLQWCEPLVVHAPLLGAHAVARDAGGVGGVEEDETTMMLSRLALLSCAYLIFRSGTGGAKIPRQQGTRGSTSKLRAFDIGDCRPPDMNQRIFTCVF